MRAERSKKGGRVFFVRENTDVEELIEFLESEVAMTVQAQAISLVPEFAFFDRKQHRKLKKVLNRQGKTFWTDKIRTM